MPLVDALNVIHIACVWKINRSISNAKVYRNEYDE